jgi:hypothetical protein
MNKTFIIYFISQHVVSVSCHGVSATQINAATVARCPVTCDNIALRATRHLASPFTLDTICAGYSYSPTGGLYESAGTHEKYHMW